MSKKRKNSDSIVYSTDPGFSFEEASVEPVTLPPAEQLLKVRTESKHRAGKLVTLVLGFEGADADLESMGRQLKNYCGTGGSVKDGEVIIQGDHRDKVIQWLQKNGYTRAKKG